MCPIQARKITNIEGSGIFDLELNKVDTTDNNIPPRVEIEEDMEDVEALEEVKSQEDLEVSMQVDDSMSFPSRRKRGWGYPKP